MSEVCYTWRRGHVRITLRCREGETSEALRLVQLIDHWSEGEAMATWHMAQAGLGLFGDWLEDHDVDRKYARWVCFCKSHPLKNGGIMLVRKRMPTVELFEFIIHSTTTEMNRLVNFLAEPLPAEQAREGPAP